jgi:hypothetical protein
MKKIFLLTVILISFEVSKAQEFTFIQLCQMVNNINLFEKSMLNAENTPTFSYKFSSYCITDNYGMFSNSDSMPKNLDEIANLDIGSQILCNWSDNYNNIEKGNYKFRSSNHKLIKGKNGSTLASIECELHDDKTYNYLKSQILKICKYLSTEDNGYGYIRSYFDYGKYNVSTLKNIEGGGVIEIELKY